MANASHGKIARELGEDYVRYKLGFDTDTGPSFYAETLETRCRKDTIKPYTGRSINYTTILSWTVKDPYKSFFLRYFRERGVQLGESRNGIRFCGEVSKILSSARLRERYPRAVWTIRGGICRVSPETLDRGARWLAGSFSRDIQDNTTETTFLHRYFHGPRAMVRGCDGFTTHVQRLKASSDTFGTNR
ncbi:hypothetical protein HOLleu_01225 [Holothuria leucospilota]|uniref:Uncharacterized protein n=1 Tax=Holothuria leucospilota TaxID=206669 RepID=A0A9Q1CPN6_HOLLE|nr:hypothetical protein HOLleu_01225 [Holothuria leucospilota]